MSSDLVWTITGGRGKGSHLIWPLRLVLGIAALMVFSLSVARVLVLGRNQSFLDQVSGVWSALAVDLASGVFYRPVIGPDGFGGTRYFPLFFTLHAAAIKTVGHPILTGQILAVLAVCALLLGVYALTRAMGGTVLLGLSSACAVLAAQPAQMALLSIKGDCLPAALNVLGLVLCARADVGRRRALAAATLFALAFAAKSTSVYGVFAAVLYFMVSKRRRLAASVLAMTAIGVAATVTLMNLASAGRAFEVLWAGVATGVGPADLLKVPIRFVLNTRGRPETMLLIFLGIVATVASVLRYRATTSLPVIYFASTFLCTLPIFIFDGTGPNHLIDIVAASAVAVASYTSLSLPLDAILAAGMLAVTMVVGSSSLRTGLVNREPVPERGRGTFDQAVALIRDRQRTILSDNPLVPIAAGQRPYMLDPFIFRIMTEGHPGFDAPLLDALRRQVFAAVVLERDPFVEPGRSLYQSTYFGGTFVKTLGLYYERTASVGRRTILTPKASRG